MSATRDAHSGYTDEFLFFSPPDGTNLPPIIGFSMPLPIFNFNNAIIVYYSPQNTTY